MGNRSEAAIKAWATRRSPTYKARQHEQASKRALTKWCQANGWKILFFEGKTGAGGLSGMETTRLKQSVQKVSLAWVAALFDGIDLHLLPELEK